MKKCRDWDYEISPCKYLAVWRPLPLASLEHTVSPFPQWIHPRGCWKLAAAAAHSSIATGHLANVLTVLTVSQPAQSLICVWLSMTQWTTACQASLSISNSQSLLKLISILSWCHPTISSSVIPFSSCLQSIPASGSFQMSQLLASNGQSIGVSVSTSVLPMNTQDWSLLGWTGWISLQSKGLSRVFSNTTVQKHQFFSSQLSL